MRQPVSTHFENLAAVRGAIDLYQADVLDELSLVDLLTSCRPDEVYNLAAPSFVPMSWQQPVLTAEFAAVGVTSMFCSAACATTTLVLYQRLMTGASAAMRRCAC